VGGRSLKEITWFSGIGLRVLCPTWQKTHAARIQLLETGFNAFRSHPAVPHNMLGRRQGKLCDLLDLGSEFSISPGNKYM
jgi:hypothetical protein